VFGKPNEFNYSKGCGNKSLSVRNNLLTAVQTSGNDTVYPDRSKSLMVISLKMNANFGSEVTIKKGIQCHIPEDHMI
jgi:hypothetical protein